MLIPKTVNLVLRAWCLWLTDIEKLEHLVDRHLPDDAFGLRAMLEYIIEYDCRIDQRCQQ